MWWKPVNWKEGTQTLAGNAPKHSASRYPPQRQERQLWWLTSQGPDVWQNSQGKEAQAGGRVHTVGAYAWVMDGRWISVSSRVQDQPRLQNETLSQKSKQNKIKQLTGMHDERREGHTWNPTALLALGPPETA